MEKNKMYFLTTAFIENNDVIRTRTVGYFKNPELAEEILNNNCYDLYECGYYNMATIEAIEDGIYKYDLEPMWFKWDNQKQGFFRCEKPILEYCDFIANIG